MENENKQLSLEDLGLTKVETPAEQAAAAHKEETTQEPVVENIVAKDTGYVEEEKPKKFIPRPTTSDGKASGFKEVAINDIAKVKHKPQKNPIESTLDHLYELSDKGIARTKAELTAPDGRINQGKIKYIEEHYEVLMKRAKTNERLMKHIRAVDDIIKTDPRFDDITEIEHKGYILFKVAHDENAGVTDEFFHIPTKKKSNVPRSSFDSTREIDKVTNDDDDLIDLDEDENSLNLGKADELGLKNFKKEQEAVIDDDDLEEKQDSVSSQIETQTEKMEEGKEETEAHKEKEEFEDDSILDDIDDDATQDDDSLLDDLDEDDDDEDEDDPLSAEERKSIEKAYVNQIRDALAISEDKYSLDSFSTSNKAISVKTALNTGLPKRHSVNTTVWPLTFAKKPIELTPFNGEEMITVNSYADSMARNKADINTYKSLYEIIYRHVVESNKPSFEDWLKGIPVRDLMGLFMAIYVTNFKDSNYITYSCPNEKCGNIFLAKKDIKDTIVFPNKKVEEEFYRIKNKEVGAHGIIHTKPIRINRDYAVSLMPDSLYSDTIENPSISDEMKKKFPFIVNYYLPKIYRIYRVDDANKELYPVKFGEFKDSVTKTTIRKIKTFQQMFKQFNMQDNMRLISEIGKIDLKFGETNEIKYQLPETECPKCHAHIDAVEMSPIDLLFMRAQLLITLYSTQGLQ